MTAATTVRAVHTACTVPGNEPPYDTAHVKVFYPADPTGDMTERMTGVVRADSSGAPYPVVVFFNGINVAADSYRWLATALAERDPANVMGVRYFGEQMTADLVKALWGGDRALPRP